MNGAIVFTWGSSVRGREAKGLEVFSKTLNFYEDLAKQGRIHGQRVFLSNTGNLSKWAGMLIVEGEVEQLQALQREETYQRLIIEAESIVENLSIQVCVGGSPDSLTEQIQLYGQTLSGMGYM